MLNRTATRGQLPRTDLALSRRCLKRTRPPFSSAQPKASPRFSSRPSGPPPLPSSPNRSSSPLLGAWTRLKTSRSDGLSGSVTCSRVAGSGAEAPRGTSREPLTCRTGGRLLTVEERRQNQHKNHFSIIIVSESSFLSSNGGFVSENPLEVGMKQTKTVERRKGRIRE